MRMRRGGRGTRIGCVRRCSAERSEFAFGAEAPPRSRCPFASLQHVYHPYNIPPVGWETDVATLYM
jgi:hypothetical protein